MRDLGYPYKSICRGRKQVGRVFRHADGHFVGMIGRDERKGATESEAFQRVAAASFGYDSVEALKENNREVRAQRRHARARAQRVVDDMLRGYFCSLDKMMWFK
jgi:hypothetical protein